MAGYRFEVWTHVGERYERLASEMSMCGALLFIEAWMKEFHSNYSGNAGLEIRPMSFCQEAAAGE